MSVKNKFLTVRQFNGSVYAIPAEIIAAHRVAYNIKEYNGNFEAFKESWYGEDVGATFEEEAEIAFAEDDGIIYDWACEHMEWSDVAAHAIQIKGPDPLDFDDAWVNGIREVIDGPLPVMDSDKNADQ
jgi:hypothetical protein